MDKLYSQINYQGFFLEETYNNWEGSIDIEKPIITDTQKAKYDKENHTWIIKEVKEWNWLEEKELEEQRIENEKQMKIQAELDEAKKITDWYEMAEKMGVKFTWE